MLFQTYWYSWIASSVSCNLIWGLGIYSLNWTRHIVWTRDTLKVYCNLNSSILWFSFVDASKMIFPFTFPTGLTPSRTFWVSTQVPTRSTTIAPHSIILSFLFPIGSLGCFISPLCVFFTRLTYTEMRHLWWPILSHSSANANVRARFSSSLSSSIDLHLHKTASLIWLSKSAPKLQSFRSFLNRVTIVKRSHLLFVGVDEISGGRKMHCLWEENIHSMLLQRRRNWLLRRYPRESRRFFVHHLGMLDGVASPSSLPRVCICSLSDKETFAIGK